MEIELRCPGCCCPFRAPAATPADAIVERMIEEGPWYALAQGCTFDEMIRTALSERGRILCPECGQPVSVRQKALRQGTGELAGCA